MIISGTILSLAGAVVLRTAPATLPIVPKIWTRFCVGALKLCCGIRLRVDGALPKGGAIIAAQHQSALDIFLWISVLDKPAMVYKQELAKIPIFGALLSPAGMIPVERGGGAAALRKLVADCTQAAAQGFQVVIFPEGTRTAPGQRASIRAGITALAAGTNAPIIPAATNSGNFWAPRAFRKYSGTAVLKIFPALSPTLSREDIVAELTEIYYEKGTN